MARPLRAFGVTIAIALNVPQAVDQQPGTPKAHWWSRALGSSTGADQRSFDAIASRR